MKKLDIISFVAIALSMVGLALLSVTGMIGHIVISAVALAIMVVCTIIQFKTWKFKVLEILYRVLYLITIISGLVMILGHIGGPIVIGHIVTACAFAALYLLNFVLKIVKK